MNFRAIDAYKRRMKVDELECWNQLQSKGRGVTAFTDDRNGNAWLFNPNLIKPSRFPAALRLTGGMTSDKATMNKVVPQPMLNAGSAEPATKLLHIYLDNASIQKYNELDATMT